MYPSLSALVMIGRSSTDEFFSNMFLCWCFFLSIFDLSILVKKFIFSLFSVATTLFSRLSSSFFPQYFHQVIDYNSLSMLHLNIYLKILSPSRVLAALREASGEMTKPAYGCQVTIQSEQEKQMMKMYRREEKRERKRGKGTDDDFSDAGLTFDPREMRLQRCFILSTVFVNFYFPLFQFFLFSSALFLNFGYDNNKVISF